MIFKEIGLGDHRISVLSDMQPFDQVTIDLAVEGLAVAVVGDTMLGELVERVADSAALPLKTRSVRHVLSKATLDDRFDPVRLQNAIDSRLDGIGAAARRAAAVRIVRNIDCQIHGC